jgi:hypothetical protein
MDTEKSPYYLSKHAFFCLADDHYVFLDLRSDEYLCLARTHTDAMTGPLNRHHTVGDCSADVQLHEAGESDPGAVIQALLKKGLLVEDEGDGKLLAPSNVDAPAVSLLEGSERPRPTIGPAHVWNFFFAAAAASKDLRWGSIERTVRSVGDRKSAHRMAATAVDTSVVSDLFRIFQTLRPYYPRPYLCLFDSLALLYFLARYRVFPQWVYGVKLEPFSAHCWIQVGDRVVNDIIDNVRGYTPIMSV